MSKKSSFTLCFHKQYGRRAQALLKSSSQHLYQIHLSLPRKLSWKNSLLLTCHILRLLVHTLATHGKYGVLNRDILMIPIQMQLSHKEKTFSYLFPEFLKSRLNFEHLKRKDDPHNFCISDITDSENVIR